MVGSDIVGLIDGSFVGLETDGEYVSPSKVGRREGDEVGFEYDGVLDGFEVVGNVVGIIEGALVGRNVGIDVVGI